jgi:hypothetical protein
VRKPEVTTSVWVSNTFLDRAVPLSPSSVAILLVQGLTPCISSPLPFHYVLGYKFRVQRLTLGAFPWAEAQFGCSGSAESLAGHRCRVDTLGGMVQTSESRWSEIGGLDFDGLDWVRP